MKKNKNEPTNLVSALAFAALAQKDKGAPYQTHMRFSNRTAVSFDGVLATGCIIEEDLSCCPHTHSMLAALERCEGAMSLAQTATGRVSVRSGKFRAMVVCCDPASLPAVVPDAPCGQLNEQFREALQLVSPFILEGATRVIMASALIRSGSVVATNGRLILEAWHGVDLPTLVVPKVFITALAKIDKKLVSFGFSQRTLTVYFDDNSWLRTQLYEEQWPDCDKVLNRPTRQEQIPADFFTALRNIYPFIDDNRLRLLKGILSSHRDPNEGAVYEVEGLDAAVTLNAKDVKMLEDLVDTIDFTGEDAVHFCGKNMRGAFSIVRE